MKIAVCMKQVPAVSEGNMDKETGVLIRTGLTAIVNVYDLAALEAALRIKEQTGADVHVYTMGPVKAENVLREAFAMGADEGFLICDRAFAGADVLSTSYTLMQALRRTGEYELILCGKQTTDGDTAQVSGALAKWMGIPHLNWVTEIKKIDEDKIRICYNMDQRVIEAVIPYPCLLSVEKDSFIPRMPSLKLKISGKKKAVTTYSIEDFEDKDESHYGLAGSATRVKKIFPPETTKKQDIKEMDSREAAGYIMDILKGLSQEARV